VEFFVLDLVEEEVAVVAVKQIREEIDELAVAVAVEELVALLELVDKVVTLGEDLVQDQEIQEVQVQNPLEVEEVAVEIMETKQVDNLVVQVVKRQVTLEVVEMVTHLVDLVVQMVLR
tara:strand:- start:107 stop:460 length:354 start_codon:yes stop_codon:yes gene_type:complete